MKKYLLFILLVVRSTIINAQDSQIEIGIVLDNTTKLSKSFAFAELLTKNPILLNGSTLNPKIVDFPYNATLGIEGVIYGNNVNLKLYHKGKKIKDLKCDSDWEKLYNSIVSEVKKIDAFTNGDKFQKISEGKQANFYSRNIVDNLPGNLSIQVPTNKAINLKSINANVITFNSKNPYKEIIEIYGKFGDTDINDIAVFKNSSIPQNFTTSVKPLVYPIANTMTYTLKILCYGGLLVEKKDNNAALNCFFTSLNTSKKIVASPKEIAILKSFAFKNISEIYTVNDKRQELAKLYNLGYDLNNDFSNSDDAQKLNENYYTSLAKVSTLCQNIENQAKMNNSAMGLAILGSITSGLASSDLASSTGTDFSALTNSINMATSQSATIQQASTDFFNQLSQSGELVNAESFIFDGVDIESGNNYVSTDVLFYLMNYPLQIKNTLLDFAKNKPILNKLVLDFYNADKSNKAEQIQAVYKQFYKIEMVVQGLESRNKLVEEKYKANF